MSFLSSLASKNAGGVYGIRCLPNGRIYVGSAVDFNTRWYNHRYQLKRGKHFNPPLQNAWSKYGEDAFEFFVIEYANSAELLTRETVQIAAHKAADMRFGFNINPTAHSRLGFPHTKETKELMSKIKVGNKSRLGSPHTEATKRKMSLSQKGRVVSGEQKAKISASLTGRAASPEARAKISAANKNKSKPQSFCKKLAERKSLFDDAQVRDIRGRHASGASFRKIAISYGTSHNVVSKVVNRTSLFYASIP